MTTSIRILTTDTLDSSPSVLLVSPDGSKILINCGEGCQRSFLEATGLRVRSVNRICLTHIGQDATGGLPGMILTCADAAKTSTDVIKHGDGPILMKKMKKGHTVETTNMDGLHIIGPGGTQSFLRSLRHFMKRDRFSIQVNEGHYVYTPKLNKGRSKKRKKSGGSTNEEVGIFSVTSIPLTQLMYTLGSLNSVERNITSYLFTTPPIQGKFLVEKAKALQIPPGPLYAQLKQGNDIKFQNPFSGEEVLVHPHEVLERGSDGMAVLFVYCPDEYVLDQFCQNGSGASKNLEVLDQFKVAQNSSSKCEKKDSDHNTSDNTSELLLEVIIHCTPMKIFNSSRYQHWIHEFGPTVKHITLFPTQEEREEANREDFDRSPFRCAIMEAMTRSLLHLGTFSNPFVNKPLIKNNSRKDSSIEKNSTSNTNKDKVETNVVPDVIRARSGMEYILIPLSKKGLNTKASANNTDDCELFKEHAQDSGALQAADSVVNDIELINDTEALDKLKPRHASFSKLLLNSPFGELIFTGTGSAIPCKHRNVAGMYLKMSNGNGMLLDVGEGTIGQLLRLWKGAFSSSEEGTAADSDLVYRQLQSQLKNIKAVWISHSHADHHLGIIRFLNERNKIISAGESFDEGDRVILIAPSSVFRFLSEYEAVDPTIRGGYLPVNCEDILPGKVNPVEDRLYQTLEITRILSVHVTHCFNSYAVVLDSTAFGRVVYSGDCRPSNRLIETGRGADLLIHEATFEDGMEEEALIKRHSTVGEALDVGRRMNAKSVILTHFSQRYPKIPPLKVDTIREGNTLGGSSCDVPVVVAFDFMRIRPENLLLASKLTPALRLLYPGNSQNETEEMGNVLNMKASHKEAKDVMSEPGAFAKLIQCQNT